MAIITSGSLILPGLMISTISRVCLYGECAQFPIAIDTKLVKFISIAHYHTQSSLNVLYRNCTKSHIDQNHIMIRTDLQWSRRFHYGNYNCRFTSFARFINSIQVCLCVCMVHAHNSLLSINTCREAVKVWRRISQWKNSGISVTVAFITCRFAHQRRSAEPQRQSLRQKTCNACS